MRRAARASATRSIGLTLPPLATPTLPTPTPEALLPPPVEALLPPPLGTPTLPTPTPLPTEPFGHLSPLPLPRLGGVVGRFTDGRGLQDGPP